MDNQQLIFDIEEDELEIFLEEVNEHLQAMESGILLLEQGADSQTLNSVFRAAHTIKALAGTIGHHRMADLTHTMETIFDLMREGEMSSSQAVVDDLLSTVDVLKILRDEVITRRPSSVNVDAFLTRLRAIVEGEPQNQPDDEETTGHEGVDKLSAEQKTQVKAYRAKGYAIVEAAVQTDATGFAPAARLSQAAIALMEVGEIIYQSPTMKQLLNSEHDNHLEAIIATKHEIQAVDKILSDVFDLVSHQVSLYQADGMPAKAKTAAAQSSTAGNADISADKTVRISVERLDMLMNLVGELVTDRNRLLQIEDTMLAQYGKDEAVSNLGEMTAHLGRVVDQLQEEVMRARMLPIASTFSKIPRLVRDFSRTAGKQVNLVIEGEETELDRSLMEFIGDPLIHLLRNALDHGLESPQERLSAGKHPTGTIWLAAAHEEGHIVISVKDDGRGIDPVKVRRAAVKRGMLTEEEAAQMDVEESIDLIFRPNLSTAEKVTEVSGRGVGMDVVRSNIERLSGSVVVETKLGEGTAFRITLPLTLAIVQTMLVSLHNVTYAVPLSSIIESLYLSDVVVNTIKGNKVIHWRNSVLPLLDLREYFARSKSKAVNGALTSANKTAIVTVAWGKQRVGLVVDKIIGKQDIVVKSLNPIMGELSGISGGTILGDGSIALIIDIPGLISSALHARKQGIAA